MRPIRSLLVYMLVVFVGGALLAPWLYALAQTLAGHWPAFARLAAQPFPRFLDRALLGVAVLGLYPLLRACEMLHERELGFDGRGGKLSRLGAGFLLGFASLACVALLAIVSGARAINTAHSEREILRYLAGAALTAVIVAVLEEFIFRATLFGILRKVEAWPMAMVVSSAVYALVHFIKKTSFAGPVHAGSGLALLPRMFQLGSSGIPMLLALFVAGCILALAYQRTGTLFFSMGLHAGWIFWLKSYGFLTTPGRSGGWLGSGNILDNWSTLPILCLVFGVVWKLKPARESAHAR